MWLSFIRAEIHESRCGQFFFIICRWNVFTNTLTRRMMKLQMQIIYLSIYQSTYHLSADKDTGEGAQFRRAKRELWASFATSLVKWEWKFCQRRWRIAMIATNLQNTNRFCKIIAVAVISSFRFTLENSILLWCCRPAIPKSARFQHCVIVCKICSRGSAGLRHRAVALPVVFKWAVRAYAAVKYSEVSIVRQRGVDLYHTFSSETNFFSP